MYLRSVHHQQTKSCNTVTLPRMSACNGKAQRMHNSLQVISIYMHCTVICHQQQQQQQQLIASSPLV
jgi:hypothetical protein